ncbi:hypothetical protein A3860_25015 [Niastella vici]|uniref:Uncharacterized protein n=1 Tax=Niastella vici TaxID=1703345 RepID=A0A1V9FY57_9BACT|nr:hypothetical protein [Niastella vici]OQP63156.1 hypothetical protein A3860_25015 [Niastella vici]
MRLNSECREFLGNKRNCTVSEKGKIFRLINDSGFEFAVFKVDACLIKDNYEQKCDYLFLVDKNQECAAYFIELKGTDLNKAISQILNSIDILYKSFHEHKIYARIVGTRVTPNIKSRRAKLDEKVKQFGGDLIIASKPELKETI